MAPSPEQAKIRSSEAPSNAAIQAAAAGAQMENGKLDFGKPVKATTKQVQDKNIKMNIGEPTKAPADGVKYKIIKVRLPDGTLKMVKRPIVPTDKTATPKTTKETASTPQTNSSTDQRSKIATANSQHNKTGSDSQSLGARNTSKDELHSNAGATESSSKSQITTEYEQAISKNAPVAENPKESNLSAEKQVIPPTAEQVADNREALHAQNAYYRQKRRHQFKNTLLRGIAGSLEHTVLDFSAFDSGDEIIDSDFSEDGNNTADDDDDDTAVSHNSHEHESHSVPANSHADGEIYASSTPHSFNVGSVLGYAVAAASNPPRPPPPVVGTGERSAPVNEEKDKVTYKITNKDVTSMEEKIEHEIQSKPLQRHFDNISFYLMASLSVVLPLLFLSLAIVLACANGKSVSTNWGKIQEAIKFAVSAWPIVFAAVVAQAFKTWATFRVERGIKLMELEQLVGSNSFASAIKQPFVLRRLNILTLGMLIIWCLSPIGTQALQNIYSLERNVTSEDIEVYYLKTYGNNRLFSPSSDTLTDAQQDELLQAVAVAYIGSLMPTSIVQRGTIWGSHQIPTTQDAYGHPLIGYTDRTGFYGVPLGLPSPTLNVVGKYREYLNSNAVLDASKPSYEHIAFNITASYFLFENCTSWQARKGKDVENLNFSISNTLGLGLNLSQSVGANSVNTLSFASRSNFTVTGSPFDDRYYDQGNNTDDFSDWDFAYTECPFKQQFINMSILCTANLDTGGLEYSCGYDQSYGNNGTFDADQLHQSMYTELVDFTNAWAASGNPYTDYSPTTPTERFTEMGYSADGTMYSPNVSSFDPESMSGFANRLGMLFNTWVGLGYCPECLSMDAYFAAYADRPAEIQGLFAPVTAKHTYTDDIVYVINFKWWGVLLMCCILLLLLGIGSVLVESMLVAPDVLGYVSTVARNSRYINLPKSALNGAMSGSKRSRTLGKTKVMMQDVKANAEVGKIALGMKHEKAERLKPGRLYR